MEKLSREEAYVLGVQACKKGLPAVPILNEEFMEKNQHTPGMRWSDNIKCYLRGYHLESVRRII